VPQLDGSVEPLPAPQLNLADDSLLDALRQLSDLEPTKSTGSPFVVTGASENTPVKSDPVIAAIAPAPVAPPKVIELPPPLPVQRAVEKSEPSLAVLEQIAPPSKPALATAMPVGKKAVRRPRRSGRRDLLIAAASIAVTGPLAWWLGRGAGGKAAAQTPAPDTGAAAIVEAKPVVSGPPSAIIPALSGRVTYIANDGQARPDSGARILVLPETRVGASKIPVDGLRGGSAEVDRQIAEESLKILGGAFTTVDQDGRYSVTLQSSGSYRLLVISRFQSAEAGRHLTPDLEKLLTSYFDRPALLVGQMQYDLSQFRYLGRDTAVRDHVFQRS
jgi:hypothetical protein